MKYSIYKGNMGKKIKYLRQNVFGYSRKKLARLVDSDLETIMMIETGEYKDPEPQLILRIADVLDSFYMNFVKRDCEDIFLECLDWGTTDEIKILSMKTFTLALGNLFANIITRNGNLNESKG